MMKYGYINKKGEIVIPYQYKSANRFSEGLAAVRENGKWGVINKEGKMVIKPQFSAWIYNFEDGIATIKDGGKYKYIDKKGELLCEADFDEVYPFNGEIAEVRKKVSKFCWGGFLLTAAMGSIVDHPAPNTSVRRIEIDQNDLTTQKQKRGYIDKKGDFVVSTKNDQVDKFHEGIVRVVTDGKSGYMNIKGEYIIPAQYDAILGFSEGVVGASKDKKWGYVDLKGNEVIPFKYDMVSDFSEGLAAVRVLDKWACINKEGTQIVRLKYNAINGFSEGVTTARINNAWVILDTAGNTIMSENAAIEDMTYSKNGLIQFKENKKWGYMNHQGDKVIEAKYDSVTDFLKS